MRFAFFLLLACAVQSANAAAPFPNFKVQEIDKTLKIGYGVRIADLNADGKPDIVVADAARVIWFDNAGGWKLHAIIENAKAGVKPDNVCLDIHDIDGDGKLDIALGADWQPNNTKIGGSLQWLQQGKNIGEPWTVHKIAESIPTLHRIHFIEFDGDDKPELFVGPLKGTDSTPEKNSMDRPVQLVAYTIPKDPAGAWAPHIVNESLHVMHNFVYAELAGAPLILTASYEGVGAIMPGGDPQAPKNWLHFGAGNQDDPKGPRGSSEVKSGMKGYLSAYLAAIEPMHGHQVVTYQFPHRAKRDSPAGPTAVRTVIDDQLKAGHALWCADLDGDGLDEIVAGFREPTAKGAGPGINLYHASEKDRSLTWEKHVLDDKGIACEEVTCADLNGDGKIDIIGIGRATGNVRIYWNQGTAKN